MTVATLDDDFIQLQRQVDTLNVPCSQIGVEWPPPPLMVFAGMVYQRVSLSALTDEESQAMPNVARGALYVLETREEVLSAVRDQLATAALMRPDPDGSPPKVH